MDISVYPLTREGLVQAIKAQSILTDQEKQELLQAVPEQLSSMQAQAMLLSLTRHLNPCEEEITQTAENLENEVTEISKDFESDTKEISLIIEEEDTKINNADTLLDTL